jgi:Uma2 family endonuclease
MNDSATKTEYTPEDLLAMPDGESYELVDGRLVERHMGLEAGFVVIEIARRLGNHCHEHQTGWVLPGGDAGYLCFPERPRLVRKPDVSFVRRGRFPGEVLPRGYAELAPDLAVEVISPNDLYEEIDQKIEEYLRAGVRLVWVVSPLNHTIRVYRVDGSSASLRDADELDGEDVLPGFRCPVRELFPPPPAVAPGDNGGPVPTPA